MKDIDILLKSLLLWVALVGLAQAVPKVTLTISAPAGSAGADATLGGIYRGMPWLPCTATNEAFGLSNRVTPQTATQAKDLLQFDIDVMNEDMNADGRMDNDLYVFLFNPNATGIKEQFDAAGNDMSRVIPVAQIWAVIGSAFNGNPALLLPFANVTTISSAKAIFKTGASFVAPSFKTTLLGSPMFFDNTSIGQNLPQGPWMMVALLVDAKKFPYKKTPLAKLQNPQNWEAWDAKPFILGTPFPKPSTGTGLNAGGDGRCY